MQIWPTYCDFAFQISSLYHVALESYKAKKSWCSYGHLWLLVLYNTSDSGMLTDKSHNLWWRQILLRFLYRQVHLLPETRKKQRQKQKASFLRKW